MLPCIRLDVEATGEGVLRGCPAGDFIPDDGAPTLYRTPSGDIAVRIARWGMPSTGKDLRARAVRRAYRDRLWLSDDEFEVMAANEPDKGVAFIDPSATVWRSALEPRGRCVVPFTAFGELEKAQSRSTTRLRLESASRPGFLAAVHEQGWEGVRRDDGIRETLDLFALVSVERIVQSHLGKRPFTPIVLHAPEDVEQWLTAPWKVVKGLRRAAPSPELVLA